VTALQALFASDLRNNQEEPALEWLAAEESLEVRAIQFARLLWHGVKENQPMLDGVIQRYASAWPIEQMSPVDRNILRISLFELLCHPQTPRKTAINEAVELAKTFGSESSARFINGVLGSVVAALEAGELASDPPVTEGR